MPFIEEIEAKLVADGVGVHGTSIILGRKGVIPAGDGPFMSLVETGGIGPTRIHNQPGANTQRPTAQIMVRAKLSSTARAMAKAAYESLDGTFNTVLSGTFYQSITARQEIQDIGPEEGTGRAMYGFNIEAEKDPS